MGEPTFTKGPWTAVQNENGIVDVNDHLDRDIVTTFGPKALADARLIAAAPELFEALTDFLAALDSGAVEMNSQEIGGHDDIPLHPWHEEWLHRTRAALLKASHGGTKDAG